MSQTYADATRRDPDNCNRQESVFQGTKYLFDFALIRDWLTEKFQWTGGSQVGHVRLSVSLFLSHISQVPPRGPLFLQKYLLEQSLSVKVLDSKRGKITARTRPAPGPLRTALTHMTRRRTSPGRNTFNLGTVATVKAPRAPVSPHQLATGWSCKQNKADLHPPESTISNNEPSPYSPSLIKYFTSPTATILVLFC